MDGGSTAFVSTIRWHASASPTADTSRACVSNPGLSSSTPSGPLASSRRCTSCSSPSSARCVSRSAGSTSSSTGRVAAHPRRRASLRMSGRRPAHLRVGRHVDRLRVRQPQDQDAVRPHLRQDGRHSGEGPRGGTRCGAIDSSTVSRAPARVRARAPGTGRLRHRLAGPGPRGEGRPLALRHRGVADVPLPQRRPHPLPLASGSRVAPGPAGDSRHWAVGLARLHAARRAGSIAQLLPGLNGYLASMAALIGTEGIDDTSGAVGHHLHTYEIVSRTAVQRPGCPPSGRAGAPVRAQGPTTSGWRQSWCGSACGW